MPKVGIADLPPRDACPLHYRGVKGGLLGREWWERKMRRNVERDAELEELLRRNGYRLVVIWEHDMEDAERILRGALRGETHG